MIRYIPRGLAMDLLFGSNKLEPAEAINSIYDGHEFLLGSCGECANSFLYSYQNRICSELDNLQVAEDFFCKHFDRKNELL